MDRQTAAIRARYNVIAPVYNLVDRFIPAVWRQQAVREAAGNVLEVGVGTGLNLPYYRVGCTVTAIDLSPGMLALAREQAAKAQIPVALKEMDLQHMTFPTATFDCIVATCVFCTVPDPLQGLVECRRVCKPGGKLILLEHMQSEHPVLKVLLDWFNPLARLLLGDNINRRTMLTLRDAGFRPERVTHLSSDIVRLIIARA